MYVSYPQLPYHLGKWEYGLSRDVKAQVQNIRNKMRLGNAPGGRMVPYESTVAALIHILDVSDNDVNVLGAAFESQTQKITNLQAALETSANEQKELRKQLRETVQSKVGVNVDKGVSGKPAAGNPRQDTTPKPVAAGDSKLVDGKRK